ncbi:MAG: SPOR domain-containing protein [Gemmatimonadota bacterium]
MRRIVAAAALAGLAGLVACGDSAREEIERERESAGLIIGTSAAEWGLLAIPRPGGVATLRPLLNPDSSVWTGATELPVARGAWTIGEAGVVLVAEDGRVIRYDPLTDDATELARLSADARMSGASGSAVVFLDSANRFAYEVGPERAVGYQLGAPAAWAAPVEGGIAVLSGEGAGALRLLSRADSVAEREVPAAGRSPALVTAWGRRVALTGPDGRSVRFYAVEGEPALVGEVELEDSVTALSVSPSSHEVYVGLADPPRIVRVSRFSLTARPVADLKGTVDDMRPDVFGGALLVHTAGGSRRVRTGDATAAPLAGSWRSDLPLGLPGDISIVLVDDEARLVTAADTAGGPLAGGAPHWWVPVRWNPAAGRTPALAEALDDLDEPDSDSADPEPAQEREVSVPEVGDAPGRAGDEGPPGHYAIVASTRQRAGVEALLSSLEDSGYPTRVQTYPDEAGETWYRGLVGPFSTRARAQAAARQLLRERDLQAWVTEIGASR